MNRFEFPFASSLTLAGRLGAVFLAALLLAALPPLEAWAQKSPAEIGVATKKLFDAVHQDDMAATQASLADGADINAVNDWGVTPIDLAVDKGHFKIAHYLLSIRDTRKQAASRERQRQIPAAPAIAGPEAPLAPQPAPTIAVEAAPLAPQAPAVAALTGPNPFDPSTTAVGAQLSIIGPDTVPGQPQAAVQSQPAAAQATAKVTAPVVAKVTAPVVAKVSAPAVQVMASPVTAVQSPQVAARVTAPAPPIVQAAPAAAVKSSARIPPEGPQSPADAVFGALAAIFQDKKKSKNAAVLADELARLPFAAKTERQTVVLPPNHLKGTTLFIGKGRMLGLSRPAAAAGNAPCALSRQGAVALCIEPVAWPAETRGFFEIDTILYKGAQAIVRYDGDTATRYHVLFPSESFADVVAFFHRRFGPPTRTGVLPINAIGTLKKENPVAAWMSLNAAGDFVTTLEIRAVDDVRGSLPDVNHGVIMLMPAAGAPRLPRRSLLKLMSQG